jgi:cytochrome P450
VSAVSSSVTSGWALPRPRRPVVLAALSMAIDPEGFFEGCLARRGDPFIVRMPGVGEVLVSGHPEGARDMFSAPPDAFEPLRSNPVEPLLGQHSLLLLSGERHRRERKLMTPPFHGERMRAYGAIIRDRALAEARSWGPGDAVVLGQAMRRITLDVILRAVLGIEGEPRSDRFRKAIGAMLDAYTPPLLVLPALRRSFGPLGPWARFVRARDEVCHLFADEIRARRQRGTAGREDILSLLMEARYDDGEALRDGELIDELRTLIVGGHDTTTTALVWAFLHVHRTPAALDALRAELAPLGPDPAADVLEKLPYLGAVCSEALRLHPVVPIVPRRALRPLTFRGHAVAPGQSIAVATTLLHTSPGVWTDPHRFWPERFLAKKYTPFEYAPFGGGVRRCIGAAFGAYQMRIVLGTILAQVRFEPHAGRVPPRVLMNITMGPRGAVRLRVGAG